MSSKQLVPGTPTPPESHHPSLPSGRAALYRVEQIHRKLAAVTPTSTARVSIATLAHDLEVSVGTIKLDLALFEMLFEPPIDYCPRRRTKYYTRPFHFRPLLWLESEEVLALLVAIRLASHSRAFPLGRDLVRALEKIAPMLAGAASFGPDTLGPVLTTGEVIAGETEARHFARLCEAIPHGREVRITYRKAKPDAEPETRVLQPLHWFIRPDACLLIAYDPAIADYRNFELIRIESVEFTGGTFDASGFDLERYLSGTFGRFIGPPKHAVVVRFEPEYVQFVRERPWQQNQQLVALPSGGAEATYRVCHTGDLEQYVLRTGGLVQVVSPADVRERVHVAAQKILEKHC